MKKDWEINRLGEVCEYEKIPNTDSNLPYIGLEDIESNSGKFIGSTNPKRVKSLTFHFTNEHILYGRLRPYLNKVLSPSFEGQCSTEIFPIKPKTNLSKGFLFWWLLSDVTAERINATWTGARMPRANMNAVLGFEIPIPPFPEQQRIVAILDDAFAAIVMAKENAEKNLQNTRALFESYLQSVFFKPGEGWVEKPFDELIESNVIGLTRNSRAQGKELQYPYVKMNNIAQDNRFDFSSFVYVDASDDEVDKFQLKVGDFLFNTRNSIELVGKACIYENDSGDVVLFNNNIMRVRFKRGVESRFIIFAFSCRSVAEALNKLKSGTTNVAAIYYKDLRSLVIPIAPIEVQRAIVSKLTHLRTETQRLEAIYEQKLAALYELKKSLLHQAFSGELSGE